MVALGQALVVEGLQVGGEVLYLLCIQVLHTHTHTERERGEGDSHFRLCLHLLHVSTKEYNELTNELNVLKSKMNKMAACSIRTTNLACIPLPTSTTDPAPPTLMMPRPPS